VVVDGCQWLITSTNRDAQGEAHTVWVTGCTNGAEIFYATYYPMNATGHIGALVESNAVPSGCEDGVTKYLWLMLASGCYLDSRTNNLLPPVYEPILSVLFDKDLSYPAETERLPAPPRLPRLIQFLNDGFSRTRDPSNTATLRFPVSWPFQNGFTNAVFAASGVTNFGKLQIPTGFQFLEYAPSVGLDNRPTLAVKRRMVVAVTRVSGSNITDSLLPPLTGLAVVQDRRLPNPKGGVRMVTYSITDRRWKTAQEAAAFSEDSKPAKR
jgi:hypothetical protein